MLIRPYLLLVLLIALFVSCKKDGDFIGPELIIVDPANFEIKEPFTAYDADIDFDSSKAHFKAAFNQKASWELTIKGNSSGAIKTFRGTSETIDSSSFAWDGSFDLDKKIKLFATEEVTASLQILGLDSAITYTFQVSNPLKPFIIISRFNTITDYATFFISGDTPDEFSITLQNDINEAPEGSGYVNLTGRDIAPSGEYFIGNFGVNNGTVYDRRQITKEPSNELYFNVFVRGNGETGTSKLEIQMEELFGDIWSIEVPTNHIGWKYVAIPYSKFPTNWAQDNDPRGKAGVKEANLIKGMGFICSSVPSRNSLNIAIDYACFTVGKPLLDIE